MKLSPALSSLIFLIALSTFAQKESRLQRDFRVEGDSLKACGRFNFGSITDCGQTIVMGQPMHITVGGLAPQDGTAFGLAFVEHKNFANEWRTSYDIDGQATLNGSWRAGAYMKAYRLPAGNQYTVAPLFNFYSQSISLTRVDFYGLGPNTTSLTHTTYGFSQNITGASAAIPFTGALSKTRLSATAELNGRFPSVRPGTDSSIPSIGAFFDNATAPGLTYQPSYFQASQGLHFGPGLFKDRVRLDYMLQLQEYVAPGSSQYSFRRWNGDFNHQIPLYAFFPKKLAQKYYQNRAGAFVYNGPDDCSGTNANQNISMTRAATAKADPAVPCPIISTAEKLEGSITLRAFLSESIAGRGSVVPFYFSPTIGGSDVNGNAMLASYPDYRFRGPNLLLFRASLEHSVGKLPIGAFFSVDGGKTALRRDDISIDHLRHSFNVGLTVRAGGLPVFYFLFAFGGDEGTHTTATISPTLLGGSARPSIF
jgi:hypothetical protein